MVRRWADDEAGVQSVMMTYQVEVCITRRAEGGFLTEARQLGLDMQPMQADVVTQIVFATINAPGDIVAKAKAAIEPQQAPPAR